jgi:hypothetical protein
MIHQNLNTMPFAPNDQLDLLFDASLVPQAAFDALAERGLHVRPLYLTFTAGYDGLSAL